MYVHILKEQVNAQTHCSMFHEKKFSQLLEAKVEQLDVLVLVKCRYNT